MSIDLTNLTHVVLRTGYAPSLPIMRNIEDLLRNRTGSNLTCLYSYSPLTEHLGVFVLSPTGFVEPKIVLPQYAGDLRTYHSQVSDLCHQLLAKKSDNPFYSDALVHLEQDLADAFEMGSSDPRPIFRYDGIIHRTFMWSLLPKDTTSPMSYQDRTIESHQVITAIGGMDAACGSICFKLDPEHYADPFSLMKTISESPLRYCTIVVMVELRCVKTDTMSILIIDYDIQYD